MSEKMYLYPVFIRIWHLINALMFLVLILTGVSMQYSNPDYPFIPFDLSVQLHNIGGIVLTFNYFIFLVGNIISFNGKYYKLKRKGLGERLKNQFIYYIYGVFTGAQPPYPINEERKFNPLQKISYVFAMYIGVPLIIITGLGLLFPEIVVNRFFGKSGVLLTALLHVVVGFVLSLFMIIHIYFCTFGKTATSNFKSMVTGYHEGH